MAGHYRHTYAQIVSPVLTSRIALPFAKLPVLFAPPSRHSPALPHGEEA